ncbi:MFS general substrate transporter [Sistotremastrum niveocremeum HHB9708]|uniref:MFS general substrate transporter n=2 Tax=Sistotremastraceae TaxID=3402574 RepID=A0A164TPJ9_9AGAM|nr:MFS general substrate transporter [Sistotremastrum niveocremeum HHB9708]KZT42202.1 MFS general substrate transporter [Sistotremastrum suecicum HHB10207 ss-3]
MLPRAQDSTVVAVPQAANDFTSLSRQTTPHDVKIAYQSNEEGVISEEWAACEAEAAYSVFSRREKWLLVFLGSLAALLSPLSANIYLPAVSMVAINFGKSVESINLTITTYMVFQAIAPMFWAPFADRYGRRIVFILCLTTLCVSCVGLALVPTNSYWLLLLLRCFQAGGGASTVALAAGLIVDIAHPSERGMFLGLYSLGPIVGPCVGPTIGGLLSDHLGWRSIFWFLCIFSGVVLLVIILILPETLRSLVGDGSIRPPHIFSRPIIPFRKAGIPRCSKIAPHTSMSNPLRLFLYPDVLLILTFNSVVYAVFYGVTTTVSVLFKETYPFLTDTDIGICFMAGGSGAVFGSWLNGRMLDRDYKMFEQRYNAERKDASSASLEKANLELASPDPKMDAAFPLERARLRMTFLYLCMFVACIIGYGWSVQYKAHISVPLSITFFTGWSGISIFNSHQNLVMDLFPTQGSSITAANNLFRCSAGAALVAVEDLILDALGPGWTFVLFGVICLVFYPLSYLEMKSGSRFREKRNRI